MLKKRYLILLILAIPFLLFGCNDPGDGDSKLDMNRTGPGWETTPDVPQHIDEWQEAADEANAGG